MKLAIVGSTSLANHPEAWRIIRKIIHQHRPTEVVSGGAEGIDSMAARVADDLAIPKRIFRPERPVWDGGDYIGFKQRNLQIATYCDVLVRIVARNSTTYGSGWTRDQAVKLGKKTEEYIIEPRTL